MDSTPVQTPPPPPQPQPLCLKSSSTATASASKSKLPIKRKTLHSSDHHPSFRPNPNSPSSNSAADATVKPPPFKFHRIWTEPDEIRFLQGLLDSTSDGLLFPRDLHLFYDRFSNAMSQPYTKSQLSEKLRRLRKKFRAISSRLLRGLDPAALSPHDRALYDLSKKMWSPEFASVSPFVANSSQGSANSSKIKVEEDPIGVNFVGCSPSLPLSGTNPNQSERCDRVGINVDGDDGKLGSGYGGGKIGGVAAKIVLDVFDQCLKEAKMGLFWQGVLCSDHNSQAVTLSSKEGNVVNFVRRWQEQRALELDVFARRLRLVIEDSLHGH